MEDLSKYRLVDWDWYFKYKERYGRFYLLTYVDKIYRMLDKLGPGRAYDIASAEEKKSNIFLVKFEENGREVSEENKDLFVKTTCSYMITNQSVIWNEEWTEIRRQKYVGKETYRFLKREYRQKTD